MSRSGSEGAGVDVLQIWHKFGPLIGVQTRSRHRAAASDGIRAEVGRPSKSRSVVEPFASPIARVFPFGEKTASDSSTPDAVAASPSWRGRVASVRSHRTKVWSALAVTSVLPSAARAMAVIVLMWAGRGSPIEWDGPGPARPEDQQAVEACRGQQVIVSRERERAH